MKSSQYLLCNNCGSWLILIVILLSFITTHAQQPGDLDADFTPEIKTHFVSPNVILLQPDDKIIVCGNIRRIADTQPHYISRLNPNGTFDTSFEAGTGLNGSIEAASLQTDGKIIICGNFTSYGSISRNGIARLNADGSLDESFNSGLEFYIPPNKVVIQEDGKVLLAGSFRAYNNEKHKIIRLNSDGSLDTSFNPNIGDDFAVLTIALQTDGKIVLGGFSIRNDGTSMNGITRLNKDGSTDLSFNPGIGFNSQFSISGTVYTIVIQEDNKIIVGGGFDSYNGFDIKNIARINMDGSLDTSFTPGESSNEAIKTAVIQPNGKIIIGGGFSTYGGDISIGIARLHTDGSRDISFEPGNLLNGPTFTLAYQKDSKILVAGFYLLNPADNPFHILRFYGGEGDASFRKDVTIFPNPFINNLKVQLFQPIADQAVVKLIDLTGREVFSSLLTIQANDQYVLKDLHDLPKGIYLLQLQQGQDSHCFKVIKSQ